MKDMSGKFYPIPAKQLLQLIFDEYKTMGSIFGLPRELFYNPNQWKAFNTSLFHHKLDNHLGVAAGPHTQMAQNIIGAWLMGARYIELKTVQTLDELEVPKPCIDMQDEGYNCEWSQELKIKESFDEYLKAWVIIHILNHSFEKGSEPGVIFNMSVGYNLEGIMNDNVQWFLSKMADCKAELSEKIEELRDIYPAVVNVAIPGVISDNITLSTMHGCPANEIEDIARYLIEKKRLHTFVKLNPTLLGPEMLKDILNNKLGFKTVVPDAAFEHDLKYSDAIKMIRSLQKVASANNLQFGLKLTNTLESVNNKNIFPGGVDMMYMSGRALHPISINVAKKLQEEFDGELMLSFSAGANAFNFPDLIACGFKTVTVCSDILKPGGYMRLAQYFELLGKKFNEKDAANTDGYIINSSGKKEVTKGALSNLVDYAKQTLNDKSYKRDYIKTPDIKSSRKLGYFDCISAPCQDTCSTNQDIPDYMYYTSAGMFDKAYEVILRTNPFPATTGMVCDHLCQGKCTRINYDISLQIREIKRFVSEEKEVKLIPGQPNGIRVAVIGAGPSGLSCAYYLALAGFSVEVFEAKSKAGGMVKFAIPGFRLTEEAIEKDIERIVTLGVKIHFDTKIDTDSFEALNKEFSSVFIGAGAQLSASLNIEGSTLTGVTEPLGFLFSAKQNRETGIGKNVVIVGGGNTAMDAARTAYRLVGMKGKVSIIYRRTLNEMPADQGEIKAVMEEGVEILELTAPEKIIGSKGHVKALLCSRMELSGFDSKGRPAPVKIERSEFEIPCDTVIPAIGQVTDIDFISPDMLVTVPGTYKTKAGNIFFGGDAMRGASTAINAIGDGRKAANEIMTRYNISFRIDKPGYRQSHSANELMIKRAHRIFGAEAKELPPDQRRNFGLVSETMDKESVVSEASRCLYCDEICNICTTVCPNFANRCYEITPFRVMLQKATLLDDGMIEITDDKIFEIKQQYQIINIANFCNECGNCTTFCPTASAPYKDKPKLYLTVAAFNQSEEGYYFARLKGKQNLIHKQGNNITTLTEFPDSFLYENDFVSARFNREGFGMSDVQFKTPCIRQARFERAAKMAVIIEGTKTIL
jgi:putative selenate reductase